MTAMTSDIQMMLLRLRGPKGSFEGWTEICHDAANLLESVWRELIQLQDAQAMEQAAVPAECLCVLPHGRTWMCPVHGPRDKDAATDQPAAGKMQTTWQSHAARKREESSVAMPPPLRSELSQESTGGSAADPARAVLTVEIGGWIAEFNELGPRWQYIFRATGILLQRALAQIIEDGKKLDELRK